MKLFLVILLCFYWFNSIHSLKILTVFSFCAHSHFSLGLRLTRELSERGHNVTMITCFPQRQTNNNFREISVEDLQLKVKKFNAELQDFGQLSYWGQLEWVSRLGQMYTQHVLTAEPVKELLNSDEEFDIVVMEHFVNDAMTIFHHRFKCPLVILAPGPITMLNSYLVGNPAPPSYIPNLLGDYDSKMTFADRVLNTYRYVAGELFVNWRYIPMQNQLLQEAFANPPDISEILYNASLMLITSHISLSDSVPLQQNVKEIGGYHVPPLKPLPKDIKDFLDNATDGVILFSMGSNLKSSNFDPETKRVILKALSKIKQKVIWKFETDLPEKSDNVLITSWLPQSDILAHPNIIGFISHGGLLGTIEAVYHGVPILGLPVFWDQIKNMEEAARKGYGVRLDFNRINDQTFSEALNEILNNPKYRKVAKQRSRIMHDQPMKQIDEAIFWIEYVVRHEGAPHLRSTSVNLKWYQIYLIDVLCFFIFILTVTWLAVKFISKLVLTKTVFDKKLKKQ